MSSSINTIATTSCWEQKMINEISYLNRGPGSPMGHKLLDLMGESKQAKGPVGQWRAGVAGLSQKGVKAHELKMSGLMAYFDTKADREVLTREDVVREADRNMVTIKEVALGNLLDRHH